MKSLKWLIVVVVVCVGALAGTAVAQQAGNQYNGMWATHSGPVNGRGHGLVRLRITAQNNALTWTNNSGSTYVCTLAGNRCAGTWTGGTGSGWFDVTFSSPTFFSGTWGYGADRSSVGCFTGHRE